MNIKSFKIAVDDSTCQKRPVVCEIYDAHDILLSRESNRCNPKDGECQRLNVVQGKDGYDATSECNWSHAEINAIAALPKNSNPHKAIIYGHDFICDGCEAKLRDVGVVDLKVQNGQTTAQKLSAEFVSRYSSLFTEDRWFWEQEIGKLLEMYKNNS